MSILHTRDYLVCPQSKGGRLSFMFFVSVGVLAVVGFVIGFIVFLIAQFTSAFEPLGRYLDARSEKKAQKNAEAEARKMRLADLEAGHGDVAAGKGFDKAMEL